MTSKTLTALAKNIKPLEEQGYKLYRVIEDPLYETTCPKGSREQITVEEIENKYGKNTKIIFTNSGYIEKGKTKTEALALLYKEL